VELRASSDEVIQAFAAWHYTAGWGNFFTVAVAVIAIIASVRVSAITMKHNANQFEQRRIDKRHDRLRAEVIDLISALSERKWQIEIVVQSIGQLSIVDRQAIHHNIEATFSENLWDSYRRTTSHAFAVLTLTEDQEASRAIGLILAALGQIVRLVEKGAANPSTTHLIDRAQADTLNNEIDAATNRLKVYALSKLGVTACDEHGHPLNKLDELSPE
jgi:hypothetical protein